MRSLTAALLTISAGIIFSPQSASAIGNKFIVARITNATGKTKVEIIKSDQYKAMDKRFRLERTYSTKAHASAAKKWKDEKIMEGYRYAGRSITLRKISRMATCNTMEKAEETVKRMKKSEKKGKTDKDAYPTKLPDPPRNNNRNGNNQRQRNNGSDAKNKLYNLQVNWIARARSKQLYAAELNSMVAEKFPSLGYSMEVNLKIPEMPKNPREKEGERVHKKMGQGGSGRSLNRSTGSMLRPEVDEM